MAPDRVRLIEGRLCEGWLADADRAEGCEADPGTTPPKAGARQQQQQQQQQKLQQLRARIEGIERRAGRGPPDAFARACQAAPEPCETAREQDGIWTLSEPQLDALIGAAGLEAGGLHEIKPAGANPDAAGSTADWAAVCATARRFALALAVRRLATAPGGLDAAPVLICASAAQAAELGAPYGHGLAALGIDPERIVVAEPAKSGDALWAIEQGLGSHGLALVLGEAGEVGLTQARRLALAAARTRTPCLLLTHPRAGPVAATASRWRIAPAPSAPHPLDAQAPGAPRFLVTLERCRGSPAAAQSSPLLLEWCDAAYSFRVVARLADRAHGARCPARGARPAGARAGRR